jgi:hypothetical protein
VFELNVKDMFQQKNESKLVEKKMSTMLFTSVDEHAVQVNDLRAW